MACRTVYTAYTLDRPRGLLRTGAQVIVQGNDSPQAPRVFQLTQTDFSVQPGPKNITRRGKGETISQSELLAPHAVLGASQHTPDHHHIAYPRRSGQTTEATLQSTGAGC
jgi:hypothetical protein